MQRLDAHTVLKVIFGLIRENVLADDFEPTESQKFILLALRKGELKTDDLVARTGLSKSQFFERGRGLSQLREAGLVDHKLRVGYFLTPEGEQRAAMLDE